MPVGKKRGRSRKKTAEVNIILIDIKDIDIIEACKFRFLHRAKKLSYADCIGYALAKRNGLKFLTGDRRFEGLENVEFVK